MKIRIYVAVFSFAIELLLLREAFAERENKLNKYINNLPVQYYKNVGGLSDTQNTRFNDENENDEFLPVAIDEENADDNFKKNDNIEEGDDMKDDVMKDDVMKDDVMKDDGMKYYKNEEVDMKENENKSTEKNVISAIGSDLSNLAVLAPADTALLKKAGINSQHIIGYVPVSSPDGHALIFPAGAVRIIGQQGFSVNPVHKKKKIFLRKQAEDENAEEEERGLRKRKRVRRRNSKGKLKRNRRHRGKNKRKHKRKQIGNNRQKQRYRNQYNRNRNQKNGGNTHRHRSRSGNENHRRTSHKRPQYNRNRVPADHDYRDE